MTSEMQPNAGSAQIYDRGYRPYDGDRTGVSGAVKSVFRASIERALGLRRKFRFKIVPVLTIVIAYIPALIFMGLGVLFGSEVAGDVGAAEYADYFGLISIAVVLFTAFVGPELLCPDRQSGLFGMYLASPLNKWNYLAAKVGALTLLLSLVSLFPVLFLLIGYSFTGQGPDGFGEVAKTVGQIIAAGLVVSIFYTLIGMAISTLTKRQGFASAGIVMVLIASGVFAGILTEATNAPDWVRAFDLISLPTDIAGRIFDEQIVQFENVSTSMSVATLFGVMALCAAIIVGGYQRMEVTK